MIISRTPFRISFFGGGTDYPAWYRENGGSVISTSINKYCYINCRYLPPFFNYKYRIRYMKTEERNSIDEIQHPSVRECLKFINIIKGVEIQHNADLPAMSGLGSSSTFTVGLLHSLYALKGQIVTKRQLALDAINVEQNMIKENVGSQDQTCAAFGGLNRINFGGPQEICVQPLTLPQEKLSDFQNHLILFYTGFQRYASEIAAEQIKNIPNKKTELKNMVQLIDEAVKILGNGDIRNIGRLLHEHWQLKRSFSRSITNGVIDDIYEAGLRAGALGGKLLGAGAGGFMIFFVEPERRNSVRNALKDLLHVPFAFENLGTQIIYYAPESQFNGEQ